MISWLAIFGLCAVTFLFAGIEAGLLSVDLVRLRSQVKQKKPGAARLARLLQEPERLLVTVLLITNVANIVALLLATRVVVNSLGVAGYFVTVAAAIPFHLFVLGVLPKSLFRRFPFRALAALGGLLEKTSLVLWPVLEVGELLGRLLSAPPSHGGASPVCRARRVKTSGRAKRARRLPHFLRAGHDS